MKNQNSLNWLTPCLLFSLISNAHAVSTLSAGVEHVCGIQEDETLICWGANGHNQAAPPSGTFSEIEAGFYFNCGLKTDSTIACWGRDTAGETSPPPGEFLQVAVGGNHVCALPDNGEPICWGANSNSQSSPPPGPFQQLASGDAHSCGLKADGSVECWGSNSHGQSNVAAETFTYIVAGYKTTCGIKSDGVAICWGRHANSHGYLTQIDFSLNGPRWSGTYVFCGLKADSTLSCPSMSSTPSGVFSYVTTGGHNIYEDRYFYGFACGIRENGLVACWGVNRNNRATPPVGVKIKQPSDFTLLQFSQADYHITEDGKTITIKVTREGNSTGAVSVDYASSDETATADSDYKSVEGTLTWADGDTAPKKFTVNILDDTEKEGDETLILSLGNPVGTRLGRPNIGFVTIIDNETISTLTIEAPTNGGKFIIMAKPNKGWEFKEWAGDCEGDNKKPAKTLVKTETNQHCAAVFEPK